MKNPLFCLGLGLILLFIGTEAGAQTPYAGGSFTAFYSTHFDYSTHVLGGYEFNDRWAAGGGLGIDLSKYSRYMNTTGFLGGYVRYTPWHGDVLWLDIKCRAEMAFRFRGIMNMDMGLVGGLRFRVSPHWDIFTDIASMGVRYFNDTWSPLVGITGSGCQVGALYRF